MVAAGDVATLDAGGAMDVEGMLVSEPELVASLVGDVRFGCCEIVDSACCCW